ncbi:MAG: SMI1/KNR4 family protein [Ktedonobacterales bacterium]
MWRELILQVVPDLESVGGQDSGPDFSPGAPPTEIQNAEARLGVELPSGLKDLLAESNGVHVIFGQHLIWSMDEIVKRNLEMRAEPGYGHCMPFDHLLFFADAGVDGIQFAFAITRDGTVREHVYSWYPISDSREWVAPSLRIYIEWWLSGKMKV